MTFRMFTFVSVGNRPMRVKPRYTLGKKSTQIIRFDREVSFLEPCRIGVVGDRDLEAAAALMRDQPGESHHRPISEENVGAGSPGLQSPRLVSDETSCDLEGSVTI